MTDDKLKPCPFCGGEQITTAPDHEFGDVTWDAVCKACGVSVRRDLEAEAITAWNHRATDAQPTDDEYVTPEGWRDLGRGTGTRPDGIADDDVVRWRNVGFNKWHMALASELIWSRGAMHELRTATDTQVSKHSELADIAAIEANLDYLQNHEYNPFEPDNQSQAFFVVCELSKQLEPMLRQGRAALDGIVSKSDE